MDVKAEIFSMLDDIEAKIATLKGAGAAAGRQTDLEVAILKKQVRELAEANQSGAAKVKRALSVLKALK